MLVRHPHVNIQTLKVNTYKLKVVSYLKPGLLRCFHSEKYPSSPRHPDFRNNHLLILLYGFITKCASLHVKAPSFLLLDTFMSLLINSLPLPTPVHLFFSLICQLYKPRRSIGRVCRHQDFAGCALVVQSCVFLCPHLRGV